MSSSPVITSVRTRSQQPQKTRSVFINHRPCNASGETISAVRFPNNRVVSSKYTAWNFLPKNLFEQFRRIANFYFLCIAVIQVTTNSPVSPITSLFPLVFVVIATALKQGYEDWLRHKTDRIINNRQVPVIVKNQTLNIKSEAIEVGDIVMVRKDDEIPCDMVLISCEDIHGKCHVTTANLDGETNLKVRDCLSATRALQKTEDIVKITGIIECEKPNTDLYEFVGVIKLEENRLYNTYPLGPSNLLIRGSRLRNSEYVYGVAVYTGIESKLAMNSRLTPNKFSTVERTVNRYLIVYLTVLLITSLFCAIYKYTLKDDQAVGKPWYFPVPQGRKRSLAQIMFTDFLAFFVIFNYVIPISLYVTLEMVKFFGSKTLVNDPLLYDASTCEKPKCNSSDLNEELGQVEYLFSDKTGTLTENEMVFRSCSVDGRIYDDQEGKLFERNDRTKSTKFDKLIDIKSEINIEQFILALVICNTVQVNKREQISLETNVDEKIYELEYLADSPDEKALVEACQRFGIVLIESVENIISVNVLGKIRNFKKLKVLEFDSARKRMSVIVEDDQGKLFVYTKGAESEMASLLVQGKVNETYQHIDDYARHGLRTLVIAMKEISKEDLQQIEKVLLDAANSLENRKERVMSSYSRVEKKLKLLGATAVEDKLQDQVPETIADLKRAGIKVWVLTGDKLETAISVAYSCNLLDSSMTQMILARQADSEACGSCVDRYYSVLTGSTSSTRTKYALIVDGRSLHMAMKFHLEKFSEMCQHCAVVLCCRMSPIQKGNVVSMVKSLKSRPVTAAIGDGANDVSMIQEAHVGFGLMGKEGRQAVNSCDFAFAKFKYVKRVLLVHGNLFYYRVAMLIHYFFYKNVIFVVPQFLFSFYNAFSSQTLYHGVLLMLYNMIYTASPILIYGIVERPISLETLMDNPSLYKKISKNRLMRPVEFLKRFLNGFFHGLVLYVTYRYLWVDTTINQNGKVLGLFAFGTSIYHGVVCVANFKLAIETRYWTVYSGASLFLSILALPAFCSLFSSFRWGILDDNMYGVYNALVLSWSFWLVTLIVIFLSLLPDFLITIVENTMNSIHIQTYFDKRIVHVTPENGQQLS